MSDPNLSDRPDLEAAEAEAREHELHQGLADSQKPTRDLWVLTDAGNEWEIERVATTDDMKAALQAKGCAVIDRTKIRHCPFCGRLVERNSPDDDTCLPTNCEAWTIAATFNHTTREWEQS